MNERINPGYGYRLIDTSTEPPMEGDEFYFGNNWLRSTSITFAERSNGCPYRRKIDVGAGYELVPETERETWEMEFTLDGKLWSRNNNAYLGRPVGYFSGILAFRRKNAPKDSFVVIDDSVTHFFATENEACERAIERCRLSARRFRVAKITRSFSPETTVTVKEVVS